ncbi:MAG TPA: hypothetical protein VG755_29455 [Nannocystaceae bacterium]|nr:hypothetical protein [Nannocystaceae bacterium]
MNGSLLRLCARVLRAPAELVDRDGRVPLAQLLPALLALIAIGGGLFGLVIGSYRGGVQHLFAAIKLPLVLLLPLLVSLPACRALYLAAGVRVSYERLVFASLVGMARAALLMAAAGPALWLVYSVALDYHVAVMLMCLALAVAGGIGLVTTASLLPGGGHLRFCAHAASLAIVGIVLAQGGWLLRPFLVRPRADVAFVRPLEADVFSSMNAALDSSRGRYKGWQAKEVPLWEKDEVTR